jgi:hypothetical protein
LTSAKPDCPASNPHLAKSNPSNAEWQRDVSVSYEKTGRGGLLSARDLAVILPSLGFKNEAAGGDRAASKVRPGLGGRPNPGRESDQDLTNN